MAREGLGRLEMIGCTAVYCRVRLPAATHHRHCFFALPPMTPQQSPHLSPAPSTILLLIGGRQSYVTGICKDKPHMRAPTLTERGDGRKGGDADKQTIYIDSSLVAIRAAPLTTPCKNFLFTEMVPNKRTQESKTIALSFFCTIPPRTISAILAKP